MNLICPHCQKMVSVSDQAAGQTTNCTFCGQPFQVPPAAVDLPVDIPLAPEPPPREPVRPSTPPTLPADEGEVYRVVPEPPKPAPPPPPPRREERVTVPPPRPAQPRPLPEPAAPPPSTLAEGYVHTRTLWVSPRVVPWIAPVSFILVFLLGFFSATGAYPGGYAVYTQSTFGSIIGSKSVDPVGDKMFIGPKSVDPVGDKVVKSAALDKIEANWLRMGLYFLAVLCGLVLALAPKVVTAGSLRLPPAVLRLWPWRSAILLGLAVVAFLLLLIQLAAGYGLENAITKTVAGSIERQNATTPEEKLALEIKEGTELGRYNLQRTGWLTLAMFFHVAAILGVLGEIWLEKRGTKPMPRVEIQW